MITYVFPGQGTQMKGMGASLFDKYGQLITKADEILGYSVKKLCLEDTDGHLNQTQYTQVAVYVVSSLSFLERNKNSGIKPDFVAGHSLGEYNALLAAGVFDFETGLRLVRKRSELMSQAKDGGMAAVLGLNEDVVEEIIKANDLGNLSIANYNTPSQIVIAGPKKDINNAAKFFETDKSVYIPLNVSGAFHSKYMLKAKENFAEFINDFNFSVPKMPVISNVEARPYKAEDIKKNLIEQITSPVKWTNTIKYLAAQGEMEFIEVGHGTVLTGLIDKIKKEAKIEMVKKSEKEEQPFENNGQNTEKTDAVKKEIKSVKPVTSKSDSSKENKKRIIQEIKPVSLGSKDFKKEYNLKYPYIAGGMYRGIASKEMVVKMGMAGMMGYFGTGGLALDEIEKAIQYIQNSLKDGQAYGMNLLSGHGEKELVELFLKYKVRNIEAAAYIQMTTDLVRYRIKGLSYSEEKSGIDIKNRIMAKLSRPEVAELFLSPPPERIVKKLLESGSITKTEAELSKNIPMADELCIEADSGGHTDQGSPYALMPAIQRLRDREMSKYGYAKKVLVGAAGGIGTPESAAAAFVLGADFILTGSINQCTVEAGTSNTVKDLLQHIDVQDTDYAPAGDMFETGAKIQVLKKGVFFPARANKLYSLYQHYNSLDEIDEKTRKTVQDKYFRRTFDEIYEGVKSYYSESNPAIIKKAEKNSKHKMALVFKWYFKHSTDLALKGEQDQKVDYQVQCGPSLGAFNQWVKGTKYEDWHNRHVDEIAIMLIEDTAKLLNQSFHSFTN